MTISALTLLCAAVALTAGLPVRYDQRQDGELNVHAHLENFVIVLIPNNVPSHAALTLLDFINLKRGDGKYVAPTTGDKSSSPDFPAGNSPYKVDLDTDKRDDEPSPAVVITSPTTEPASSKAPADDSADKKEDSTDAPEKAVEEEKKKDSAGADDVPAAQAAKSPKSIDLAVDAPQRKSSDDEVPVIKSSKSPAVSGNDEVAHKLKLLRSGLQECGPGQRRDRQGNCYYAKSRSGQYFTPEGLLPSLQFGLSPAVD